MKFGMRKPSISRSLKSSTTGRMKREVRRAINPAYGKKGTGYLRNPRKAVNNKIYKKSTFGGVSGARRGASAAGCLLPTLIALCVAGTLIWMVA